MPRRRPRPRRWSCSAPRATSPIESCCPASRRSRSAACSASSSACWAAAEPNTPTTSSDSSRPTRFARTRAAVSSDASNALLEKFYYLSGDYDDPGTYQRIKSRLAELRQKHHVDGCNCSISRCLPSSIETIIEQLGSASLSGKNDPDCERVPARSWRSPSDATCKARPSSTARSRNGSRSPRSTGSITTWAKRRSRTS